MARVDFLIERMTRQGLAARSAADPAAVAAAAVGLQAQDVGAARLGVRARSTAVDEAAVVNAIQHERSVVRTWLMRSTVHLVAAADLRWMAALYGPVMERNHRTRWRNLGITEPMIETALAHARELLDGRGLTRHELAAELAARGLELGQDGQVPTHVLAALTARGLTCRGADRGRDATFVLIDDWVGPAPAPGPTPLGRAGPPVLPRVRAGHRGRLHDLVGPALGGGDGGDPRRADRGCIRRAARLDARRCGARARLPAAADVRQLPARLPRPDGDAGPRRHPRCTSAASSRPPSCATAG